MIIRSKDTSLSFEIDDYQYPEHKSQEKGYDYDANWLEVAIQYSNHNEVEKYKDACLLTYELEELIDGLSEVIADK